MSTINIGLKLVTVLILLSTAISAISVITISEVNADKGGEPANPFHVGNPNHLSVGPPVPSCTAFDQGHHQGNPDDTREGCK